MQPDIKSGTVWIAYSWQDTLVSMKAASVPVEFLNPSQGRLSWFCGFMLGTNTRTTTTRTSTWSRSSTKARARR